MRNLVRGTSKAENADSFFFTLFRVLKSRVTESRIQLTSFLQIKLLMSISVLLIDVYFYIESKRGEGYVAIKEGSTPMAGWVDG